MTISNINLLVHYSKIAIYQLKEHEFIKNTTIKNLFKFLKINNQDQYIKQMYYYIDDIEILFEILEEIKNKNSYKQRMYKNYKETTASFKQNYKTPKTKLNNFNFYYLNKNKTEFKDNYKYNKYYNKQNIKNQMII